MCDNWEKKSEIILHLNTIQTLCSVSLLNSSCCFSLISHALHGYHEFFLDTKRKLPQTFRSMSFMTFSYKWGHIKWLLLPFLWKCQESKNIYSKTIFSFYMVSLVLSRTGLFSCFHVYKIWIFKDESSLWKTNVSWFPEKYIKCSMIWIYT